jgi:hypothetical protein
VELLLNGCTCVRFKFALALEFTPLTVCEEKLFRGVLEDRDCRKFRF